MKKRKMVTTQDLPNRDLSGKRGSQGPLISTANLHKFTKPVVPAKETTEVPVVNESDFAKAHKVPSEIQEAALEATNPLNADAVDQAVKESVSEGDAVYQCAATTKSGKPCSKAAMPGKEFCHIHQPKE